MRRAAQIGRLKCLRTFDCQVKITQRKIKSMTTLIGTIEHITYHNEQTRYTVARLKTSGAASITAVGYLAGPIAGEAVRLTGEWNAHPRYGQQFCFDTADIIPPATEAGIQKYLCAGFLKGIGPATAEKIVRRFGPDTFSVIEETPERLTEVEGIGGKKAAQIGVQWRSHHAVRDIMRFLQENGVKPAYGAKIFKTYGNDALDILRKSPFRLVNDIPGIGFYIADRIASTQGIETDAEERAAACILHILRQAATDGHVFMPMEDLIETAGRLFEIDSNTVQNTAENLAKNQELVVESIEGIKTVYLCALHRAETSIAEKIKALRSVPADPLPVPVKEILSGIEHRLVLALSSEQREVLESIFDHRIAVITGGPGTGKTTLIKSITMICKRLGLKIRLAAPTGRAARRLSEVSGEPAQTIHKLLGYSFEEQLFAKNAVDPIDADMLIVDEASMVDTVLMHHLITAVPFKARLLMVGDAFQLPPVGPGNLLSDLIASNTIPVYYLKTIFRQAAQGSIVANAHRVRNGDTPELLPLDRRSDQEGAFYFLEQIEPGQVASTIVNLCVKRLPEMFGLNPLSDIQVLSPMHKGKAGTLHLNSRLQHELNTASLSISNGESLFKVGDRVMHLKNNYQKEVYNGDIGVITGIDKKKEAVSVDFYGREVCYALDELDELTLGYAISVHKSQGSEYPAVVMPLVTEHYIMLQRNLLYTAITRAREIVVLVGSRKGLAIALNNNKPQMRRSALANRLR